MPIPTNDKEILRRLGRRIAEIAQLPIQEQRRKLAAQIENMQQVKPYIYIDQEPWNELNVNGELNLHCTDAFCRGIEQGMRRTLYSGVSRPPLRSNPTGKAAAVIDVSAHKPRRIPSKKWHELIKKVWEADPLLCPKCQKEMRIMALINERDVIERILRHLGL